MGILVKRRGVADGIFRGGLFVFIFFGERRRRPRETCVLVLENPRAGAYPRPAGDKSYPIEVQGSYPIVDRCRVGSKPRNKSRCLPCSSVRSSRVALG